MMTQPEFPDDYVICTVMFYNGIIPENSPHKLIYSR